MLLIYTDAIDTLAWPLPLPLAPRALLAVIASASEIDRSRCTAAFFFERVTAYWSATQGGEPENFIILAAAAAVAAASND